MKQDGDDGPNFNVTPYRGVYDNWDTEGKGSKCPSPRKYSHKRANKYSHNRANKYSHEQTNIYTIKQTNIHTNEQTNKFSRRKVHIWLWAEPDDNDLHQLHWLAQVSPLWCDHGSWIQFWLACETGFESWIQFWLCMWTRYFGGFSASLSSAIASMVGAPRILQVGCPLDGNY